VPLLCAGGAGAASRFAIGIVVVTGMMVGTLFTLFVRPYGLQLPCGGPPRLGPGRTRPRARKEGDGHA
jgi:multidrug efflux pump